MIELKPGQKVIVKKTGKIGVIMEVIRYAAPSFKIRYQIQINNIPIELQYMPIIGFPCFNQDEIHPLKFDVGEEVKLKHGQYYLTDLKGKIENIKWIVAPHGYIRYSIDAGGGWCWTAAEDELEKVEQPQNKPIELGKEFFDEHRRIQEDALRKLKEKEEMKKSKFKKGDKVKVVKDDHYLFPEEYIGKIGIVLGQNLGWNKNGDYKIQYEDDFWFAKENMIEKVEEEPKRYNPLNLEFGKEYWNDDWIRKPCKLIGLMESIDGEYYIFEGIHPSGDLFIFNNDIDEIKEVIKNKKFMLYSDYLAQQERKAKFKEPKKEPYSKEFWVCVNPHGECDRFFKVDDLTGLCTTGGIYKTEKEAAADKYDAYTQIKQFLVTEVV